MRTTPNLQIPNPKRVVRRRWVKVARLCSDREFHPSGTRCPVGSWELGFDEFHFIVSRCFMKTNYRVLIMVVALSVAPTFAIAQDRPRRDGDAARR